MPNQAICYTAL